MLEQPHSTKPQAPAKNLPGTFFIIMVIILLAQCAGDEGYTTGIRNE